MAFGFSYVGLIYLIMLMLPNLLWTKNQPKNYEKYAGNEKKILVFLERTGEVLVSCLVLIFSDFNIKPWSSWSWWLLLSFLLITAQLSIGLGLFNLIPIPPLDGSKVLFALLPPKAYMTLMRYERFGMLVLLLAVWLDVGGSYLSNAIYMVYQRMAGLFF